MSKRDVLIQRGEDGFSFRVFESLFMPLLLFFFFFPRNAEGGGVTLSLVLAGTAHRITVSSSLLVCENRIMSLAHRHKRTQCCLSRRYWQAFCFVWG